MKQKLLLIIIFVMSLGSIQAQCYKRNLDLGKEHLYKANAWSQKKTKHAVDSAYTYYKDAWTYFNRALKCPDRPSNIGTLNNYIKQCDARIKPYEANLKRKAKETDKAKAKIRQAEREKEEAEKRAEEEVRRIRKEKEEAERKLTKLEREQREHRSRIRDLEKQNEQNNQSHSKNSETERELQRLRRIAAEKEEEIRQEREARRTAEYRQRALELQKKEAEEELKRKRKRKSYSYSNPLKFDFGVGFVSTAPLEEKNTSNYNMTTKSSFEAKLRMGKEDGNVAFELGAGYELSSIKWNCLDQNYELKYKSLVGRVNLQLKGELYGFGFGASYKVPFQKMEKLYFKNSEITGDVFLTCMPMSFIEVRVGYSYLFLVRGFHDPFNFYKEESDKYEPLAIDESLWHVTRLCHLRNNEVNHNFNQRHQFFMSMYIIF